MKDDIRTANIVEYIVTFANEANPHDAHGI